MPVGIGNEVDVDELEKATKDNRNVLTADTNDDPNDLGGRMIDRVLEGKSIAMQSRNNIEL